MGETRESASVRRAYDIVAEDYAVFFHDARTETVDNLAVIDAFADIVTESSHPGVVLDAGCGTGRMSRYLAARGVDAVGPVREYYLTDPAEVGAENMLTRVVHQVPGLDPKPPTPPQ